MNGEKRFICNQLWDLGQWRQNCGFVVDAQGLITQRVALSEEMALSPAWQRAQPLPGICVPTQVNAHSHAFQWGFAGQTEFRTAATDSFWTWRQQMFRFLETLDPQGMYDVAKAAYQQLLFAGYSHVGEFHYVHADPEGRPLQPLTAFADAVVQAALDVGLEICLLPTLYQRGGFDGRDLTSGQRRFFLSADNFWNLLESIDRRWQGQRGFRSGLALHSLRAVAADVARQTVERYRRWKPEGVIHIHAAEQTLEVNDCLNATGKRPVEWLLDEMGLDARWSIVHATHLTDRECHRLAASQATVVLCPTTEASLGDGIFSAELYSGSGGHWAIGGDSHVGVSISAELRMMEYAQRLTTRRRVVLANDGESSGEFLYRTTLAGGRRCLGLVADPLALGEPLNLIVLEPGTDDRWMGTEPARWLDQFLFTEPVRPQAHILHRGRWLRSAPLNRKYGDAQ